ncbi:MAG TPA: hypothetical protein VFV58_00115 [Blastocatellia bacterium]|jgi:hypothetical protein|nr:hypothetical protein [Blastocatellia bacterium]
MKHNVIRYSMIVLLIGLVALAAGRAEAQTDQKYIELLSYSLGFAPGETARISVTLRRLANPGLPPINARIQLLDTEGRMIAQSDEIKVEPGQIRFWDAPRNQIPVSGEPRTGRLQVRARMVVMTSATDFDQESVMPTIEIIDGITGRTLHNAGKRFLIFVCDPITCGSK